METTLKVEFANKSNSKRRDIFRKRVRLSVISIIKSFYAENDLEVPEAKINQIANLVVEDFIKITRTPEFIELLTDPPAESEESRIDPITKAVKDASAGREPFAFLQ